MNSANIIFVNKAEDRISPTVYLHWYGGPEVYAFLDELDIRNIKRDQHYECARFIQIVTDYIDGGEKNKTFGIGVSNGPNAIDSLSLGILNAPLADNGFYIVCREDEERVVNRYAYSHDGILVKWSQEEVMKENEAAYQNRHYRLVNETLKQLRTRKCLV